MGRQRITMGGRTALPHRPRWSAATTTMSLSVLASLLLACAPPAPPAATSTFTAAPLVSAATQPTASAAQPDATAVVRDSVIGRSPLLVGANPGLTISPNWEAWVRDSRMNAAHEWANMEEIEPNNEDGDYGDGVTDEATFQQARAAVLAAPEQNRYLTWSGFKFANVDRRMAVYDRLGIVPIVVISHSGSGSSPANNRPAWMANVPTTWQDLWEWWEFCFTVAYHTARLHEATRFMMQNEPDRSVQGFGGRVSDYVRLLQYGADAARQGVHTAHPDRVALIHAPGLAEPTSRRGSYLQTVLRDGGANVDVLDYHQYGPAAHGEYAARAAAVRDLAAAAGAPRPLFVSEYNISQSGERGDMDTPDDAFELAEAQRQLVLSGVDGLLVYRFSFPAEFRNLSLVRSSSTSGRALVEETLGYQLFKQLAMVAAGGKELLDIQAPGPVTWLATRDAGTVYLLGINRAANAQSADIDLSALDLEGHAAIVRVAAAGQPNQILTRPVVRHGRLTFSQPPTSTIMVAIDRAASHDAPIALRIEPPPAELDHNRVLSLAAIATFADGGEADVTDQVVWTSSDGAVARVNSSGLAIGLTPGTASITAAWDTITAAPLQLPVR